MTLATEQPDSLPGKNTGTRLPATELPCASAETPCVSPARTDAQTSALVSGFLSSSAAPVVPTASPLRLREYLSSRKPVADYRLESPLYQSLPDDLRADVADLHRCYSTVQSFVNSGLSIARACAKIYPLAKRHETLTRFRNRYDAWSKAKDWTILVDRSRAGGEWIQRDDSLPLPFLRHCAAVCGAYKRSDARSEAIRSIHRQWRTGRDRDGHPAPIPGYGYWQDWFRKNHPGQTLPAEAPLPPGWGKNNILNRIKKLNLLPAPVARLLLEGSSAARRHLPQVHASREGLRFMERIQFDDLKTDWLVFDPRTGEAMDLWLLIAHDVATTITLGFGLRPARSRLDGSQEHLTRQDMRQLCGWLLERFGLPPYLMHWVLECGTATLNRGEQSALHDFLGDRLQLHYTSMHGGRASSGYLESAKGNARGKASLESVNRLRHIIGADLPGQVGPHYSVRPSDNAARVRDCSDIWKLSQHLPEHLRGQEQYTLLTIEEARKNLFRIFNIANHRTDHRLEGFSDILEWYNADTGLWLPQNTFPGHSGIPIRKRKQSPVERAKLLVASAGGLWSPVSPEIVRSFYEHTARPVTIKPSGLVDFTMQGNKYEFAPPGPWRMDFPAGTRLLAYCHPDDPAYLHITDGRGSFVGTWLRRHLCHDTASIQAAIRYTESAVKQTRLAAAAIDLNRPVIEAVHQHNAALLAQAGFASVVDAPASARHVISSPVAAALSSIPRTKKQTLNQTDAAQQLAASLDSV